MPAGYSGTPLAKKLGFKDGMTVYVADMPASVRAEIETQASPRFVSRTVKGIEAAHVFARQAKVLERLLARLRPLLAPNRMVWASWLKKAAAKNLGIETDITEDVIRAMALPIGYVDVKVCAVDEVWSGLKLVIRKTLR